METKEKDNYFIEAKLTPFWGWCFILSSIGLACVIFAVELMAEEFNWVRLFIIGSIAVIVFRAGVRLRRETGAVLLSVAIDDVGFSIESHREGVFSIPFSSVREIYLARGCDSSSDELQIECINGRRVDLDQFSSKEVEEMFEYLEKHFDGAMRKAKRNS